MTPPAPLFAARSRNRTAAAASAHGSVAAPPDAARAREPRRALAPALPAGIGACLFDLDGVAAGRAGGFGWVVGVDRVGQAEALRRDGADTVVRDLAELLGGP